MMKSKKSRSKMSDHEESKNGDDESENDELDTRTMVLQQNKKKKKSGGFQSMGLSQFVFTGIMRKGYKVPTPIQRKSIPIILEGKDVVAMARTGSGKTAAFLIPMFERLKARSAAGGARALILSPTRELALQTMKFTREIGRFTGLKTVAILGGDRMDDQFAAIHENPDVIIATPGRFLHVVVEMDLKLSCIEYVVFDEADRLFEMGFQLQLREIFKRLPDNRQTLLFSATLPKLLVDFAKAGLNDPILIRLDVETKLSENLKVAFFNCRSEDKMAILLDILQNVIMPNEMTVVFLATKHHVEYTAMVLEKAGIPCTYIYSSLDQIARRENVMSFCTKTVSVLLVTDLAARGIDIPLLDNVINVNFPAKCKLFVHRVGRVARAGRMGSAFSLVSSDELPYVLDLHLFLGRPMRYANFDTKYSDWNGMFGSVPQHVIDEQEEQLQLWHGNSDDLVNMKRVCHNAYTQYLKSREVASSESIRRVKEDAGTLKVAIHPLFDSFGNRNENERSKLLVDMKSYKPSATIFEVNSTTKTVAATIMKGFREKHSKFVETHHNKIQRKLDEKESDQLARSSGMDLLIAEKEDIEEVFDSVVAPNKRKSNSLFQTKKKKQKQTDFKDNEYYLNYTSSDHHSEKGLGLDKPMFNQEIHSAVLDLTADEGEKMFTQRNQLRWDRKTKKYLNERGREKTAKIKTDSGVWIPATYCSNIYKEWQKKARMSTNNDDSGSENDDDSHPKSNNAFRGRHFRNKSNLPKGGRPPKRELKTTEEIYKSRKTEAKQKHEQQQQQQGRNSKRAGRGGGGGGKRGGGRGGRREGGGGGRGGRRVVGGGGGGRGGRRGGRGRGRK